MSSRQTIENLINGYATRSTVLAFGEATVRYKIELIERDL